MKRTLSEGSFCSFPASAFKRVDFPEPGGPSSRQMRLGGMTPLTSSRTVNLRLSDLSSRSFTSHPCRE